MAPFASPEELSLDTGEDYDRPRALAKLQAATNAIIGEIGWDPRESERTYTVPGSWWGSLWLPARNVTVLEAVADGVALAATDLLWAANGEVRLWWPSWSVLEVVITYTAGYDPLPDVLKDVCIEEAARRLGSSPRGVLRSRSETAGPFTVAETYMGSGSDGRVAVSPLESDRRLDPYRLGAVVA